jgi:restriction system protein
MTEATVWGMHAGSLSQADSLFRKRNVLALGWEEVGDLAKLPKEREAFKAAVVKAYPDAKPGAIPVYAGVLYRFVHDMQVGEVVVYPSRPDRQVNLGRVEGEYVYDPSTNPAYPNRRAVTWLKMLPRTHFSQGALYEIGSAVSLFQVRNYADEFLAALQGTGRPTRVKRDMTVAVVAEDIEENTRDYILKTLSQELKGHPLAHFIAHLLGTMGYQTRISPEGTDSGVDIIAHRDELGFEPPIIKVQVKSSDGKIGDPDVSALYGKVAQGEHGLLVALGDFTAQAKNFAKSKSNLRLIDGKELVDLILAHYEQFAPVYKGLLPLKRVYVPQPPAEEEE